MWSCVAVSAKLELPEIEDQTAFNLERWDELLQDPIMTQFQGRIETDAFGHVLMSPPPAYDHGGYQVGIVTVLLKHFKDGRVSTETPISTSAGVRIADATWASKAFLAEIPSGCVCLPKAPEICVEVVSPSNTRSELEEKRRLYFEAGTKEFWLCKDGQLSFFPGDSDQASSQSLLCPEFPVLIEL
jgi:Uma2 family endonuclease